VHGHLHYQVQFADRFVDPALGFCAGINFFVFEAALVPFEIVAFNLVLRFWTDAIPLAAVIVVRSFSCMQLRNPSLLNLVCSGVLCVCLVSPILTLYI
jgi:amino acid permease